MLNKEEKLLIMLNHSSRELLQIIVALKIKLSKHSEQNVESIHLQNALDSTWHILEKQINDVSKYLKVEEDILQAYSFSRLPNDVAQ